MILLIHGGSHRATPDPTVVVVEPPVVDTGVAVAPEPVADGPAPAADGEPVTVPAPSVTVTAPSNVAGANFGSICVFLVCLRFGGIAPDQAMSHFLFFPLFSISSKTTKVQKETEGRKEKSEFPPSDRHNRQL